MDKKIKRIAAGIMLLVSVVSAVSIGAAAWSTWDIWSDGVETVSGKSESEVLTNADFIRLHVIANSDSFEDQSLKLDVRDAVLEMIDAETGSGGQYASLQSTSDYISKHITSIEETAGDVIERSGRSYGVDAKLDVSWIPEKEYRNVVFPAGNYRALTITIGEGHGQNWWCVIFPPLCLIGAEQDESLIDDGRYDVITECHEEPIELKLKFKSAEVLKEISKSNI